MNAERREVQDFIGYVRTQYGAQWHVRHVYHSGAGWGVEWRIEPAATLDLGLKGKSITMTPILARQTVREIRAGFQKHFRSASAEVKEASQFRFVMGFLDKFDALAKQALHWNRDGVKPQPEQKAA